MALPELSGEDVTQSPEKGASIAPVRCPVHAGKKPGFQARESVHDAASVAQRRIPKYLPRGLAGLPDGLGGVGQRWDSSAELSEQIATQQIAVGFIVEIAALHRVRKVGSVDPSNGAPTELDGLPVA
jgi:hypothetical protein